MKLNNKGFTLIELLAAVVILLIISVIAIPSIGAAIERNKVKKNEAQKDVLESYAEIYYNMHKNDYTGGISSFCVDIDDLNLAEAEKKDADGDEFEGSIIYKNNEFVYQDSSCPK